MKSKRHWQSAVEISDSVFLQPEPLQLVRQVHVAVEMIRQVLHRHQKSDHKVSKSTLLCLLSLPWHAEYVSAIVSDYKEIFNNWEVTGVKVSHWILTHDAAQIKAQ